MKFLADKRKELSLMRQMKKEMNRLKQGELHYFDWYYGFSNVNATAAIIQYVGMPGIGTGLNNSAAGRFTFHKFDINYVFLNKTTTIPMAIRLLFGQLRGDATETIPDVLENTTSDGLAVTSPLAYKNQDMSNKVLLDKHIDTDPQWGASRTGFYSVKPAYKETKYSAQDTAWASGIPFIIICNTNAASGLTTGTVYVRIWFYDGA
jgi:hypothetical protein